MVESDVAYIQECLGEGLVQSPCLELGVGYDGPNNKKHIQDAGIEYFGADMRQGANVDYVLDFEGPKEIIEQSLGKDKFGSILILNVLEHTFEPIRVLDNALNVLRSKGTCIIITPAIWPLHDYPYDCWRINPNFYEEYCKRRSLTMLEDHFKYVGFHSVPSTRGADGTYVFPKPSQSRFRTMKSRLIHKLFNTYGRGMAFPSHVAIGAVIQKP